MPIASNTSSARHKPRKTFLLFKRVRQTYFSKPDNLSTILEARQEIENTSELLFWGDRPLAPGACDPSTHTFCGRLMSSIPATLLRSQHEMRGGRSPGRGGGGRGRGRSGGRSASAHGDGGGQLRDGGDRGSTHGKKREASAGRRGIPAPLGPPRDEDEAFPRGGADGLTHLERREVETQARIAFEAEIAENGSGKSAKV